MEIIYGDAANINLTAQKRLLRVVQGQTQATPTSGYIDPSLRNSTGGVRVPLAADKVNVVSSGAAAASPFSRTKDAFTFEGSLTPGLVLVKTVGENYAIADGGTATANAVFGLLGQWVGGTFDGIKNTNEISAWQGPDSVYDLLAPGFGEIEAAKVKENTEGISVPLYAGPDGRLTTKKPALETIVATLIDYNPSVLRFRLVI
jgi:hypothetical protein